MRITLNPGTRIVADADQETTIAVALLALTQDGENGAEVLFSSSLTEADYDAIAAEFAARKDTIWPS